MPQFDLLCFTKVAQFPFHVVKKEQKHTFGCRACIKHLQKMIKGV